MEILCLVVLPLNPMKYCPEILPSNPDLCPSTNLVQRKIKPIKLSGSATSSRRPLLGNGFRARKPSTFRNQRTCPNVRWIFTRGKGMKSEVEMTAVRGGRKTMKKLSADERGSLNSDRDKFVPRFASARVSNHARGRWTTGNYLWQTRDHRDCRRASPSSLYFPRHVHDTRLWSRLVLSTDARIINGAARVSHQKVPFNWRKPRCVFVGDVDEGRDTWRNCTLRDLLVDATTLESFGTANDK